MLLTLLKTLPVLSLSFTLLLLSPAIAKPPVNKALALQAHNNIRASVKQPPLQWSSDLEHISQQWVNQLAQNCKIYHHKGNIPFGENIFISTAPATVVEAINLWGSEKNIYNYQQNRCQAGKQCGHYTQIVWKGTTELGCAMQSCANGSQIYVCSYFPAGNIIGARPY